jgi:hypothetical protein
MGQDSKIEWKSRTIDLRGCKPAVAGDRTPYPDALDAASRDTPALGPGQFRRFILGLEGRHLGVFKRAARFAGLSLEEFISRLDAGQKRCTKCGEWKTRDRFGSEASRWDGLDPKCLACHRKMGRDRYEAVPLDERRPSGPPRHLPRDGDKLQACHLINLDIRMGRRPDPNALHCARCGHKGSDRRHEYHHHMGYAARHHYDVIPLCSKCHHEEH